MKHLMKNILILSTILLILSLSYHAQAGYASPMTGDQAAHIVYYGPGVSLGQPAMFPPPYRGAGEYTRVKDVYSTNHVWKDKMKAAAIAFNACPSYTINLPNGGFYTYDCHTVLQNSGNVGTIGLSSETPYPIYTPAVQDQMDNHVLQCYPGLPLKSKKEAEIFAARMGAHLIDFYKAGFGADYWKKIVAPTIEAYAKPPYGQTYAMNIYRTPFHLGSIYQGMNSAPSVLSDWIQSNSPLAMSSAFPTSNSSSILTHFSAGYYVVPNRNGALYNGSVYANPTWVPFGPAYALNLSVHYPHLTRTAPVLAASDAPLTQYACLEYSSWGNLAPPAP